MSNFHIMTSITAYYEPQGSQSFRCSDNFPDWNTPPGGKIKFEVTVPDGYPQPTFAIDHDKVGADTRWYSNLSDGAVIPVESGDGGAGGHALYIGTTSKLPDGLSGKAKYSVTVFVSND